ncbi:MAG TPA: tetratricopeptide repeat protein [Candidatus Methanoperedens sp.]|nr:tetratricopeptide repeat protein [Candidatus Methanoperedens sp.]
MRRSPLLAAALLVLLVLVAYLPATQGGWIWDDDFYVTKNEHLDSAAGLGRIWLDRRATPQYYPLVFTTFWVEKRLWGLAPLGYHLDNVLLHAANAVLAWLILRRLGLPAAWLAAAVFALHPVHVESVAWVTERKNVLSGLFYLGALLAWLRFAPPEAPLEEPHPRRWGVYALSLLLFAAALLSKSVTGSLPAAVLVILWWKRGRIGWRDVLPLVPFFLLGALAGANTAHLERYKVGTHGPEWALSALQRTLIAGRALWFYAGKLLWPQPLIFTYPRWQVAAPAWWWYAFPAGVAALTFSLWSLRRRIGRGPLAAALFFGGTLVPALGFVNTYPMRYSFVADHFQYLASLGLIALAAGAAGTSVSRRALLHPRLPAVAAALLLAVLGAATWRQATIYRSEEALWRDTLAKDPGSPLANISLGNIHNAAGDLAAARRHYERALVDKPDFAQAWYNLGTLLGRQGDLAAAIRALGLALRYNPYLAEAYANLGVAYGVQGNHAKAAEMLERAVQLKSEDVGAWMNLASARARQGELALAADAYRSALERDPANEGLRRRLRETESALAASPR